MVESDSSTLSPTGGYRSGNAPLRPLEIAAQIDDDHVFAFIHAAFQFPRSDACDSQIAVNPLTLDVFVRNVQYDSSPAAPQSGRSRAAPEAPRPVPADRGNIQPAIRYAPDHKTAPALSMPRNLQGVTLNMPAIGGAMVLRPGTNLAKSSQFTPCFPYVDWVFCTQVSGSSEMRQKTLRMEKPRQRPSANQSESPISDAIIARDHANARFMRPSPESAPAASSMGVEGIGRPDCSARTNANSSRYPCRSKNSTVGFTPTP